MADKLDLTLQALRSYAEGLGYWPTKTSWNAYAVPKGLYTGQGLEYQTKKNWEWYRNEFNIPKKRPPVTKEDVEKALLAAAADLGSDFRRSDYDVWRQDKDNAPTHAQIARVYGSWNNAKSAVNLPTNLVFGKTFTDEELLEALRLCAIATKPDFSEADYEHWCDRNVYPNVETIRKRFGSMQTARQMLHLPANEAKVKEKYSADEITLYLFNFISERLRTRDYSQWAKERGAPSLHAVENHLGSYQAALENAMRYYLERTKAPNHNG